MSWIPRRFQFTVWTDVGGVRRIGRVCKWNRHTMWVEIMQGAKTSFIIKRHKVKHNLKWRGIINV